jgi:acetate kinase
VRVLVVNAGSSSLKLTLLGDDDETLAVRELQAPRAQINANELADALRSPLGDADAVGHRIVHGGVRFREAVRVDASVERALRELSDLAPLHQPKSLAALDAVSERLPALPAVACFDTAFHATLPPAASTYAVPAAWRERLGVRRFGFHGLSHGWIARRAPELLGLHERTGLRIVSCHLGAGASLCAIHDGHSIDTTMGFTPLEGLVMATRSGSIDPGLLLWLAQHEQIPIDELADTLEHGSGLLGLVGTPDMREVLARETEGDAASALAVAVYLRSLRAHVAAMAAAMDGLDVLCFTGGVGERSAELRRRTCAGLGFLGVELADRANEQDAPDRLISAPGAEVSVIVIAAREDLEIARQTRAALGDR